MGLFNSYVDDQSAASGGGSLIDRLLAQYGVQSQYQPAQSQAPLTPTAQQMMAMVQPGGIATGPGYQPGIPGAPAASAAPSPAPVPSPAQQASPLAVGGYQMPRMGNPDLYQPQQVMTPPNAQPTQGQMPAQVPLPPQLQPMQTDGLGNHLAAGARNFFGNAHGGLLSALVSGVEGLATGQRNDPQALQQQSLNTQFQALMAAGVPREKAILAVINPEFAKTIIPQALGNEKYSVVQTGEDGLGRKQYEVFNPATGEHKPINSAASDGAAGGLGNMDLTGKEYLASLPKSEANIVQQMVEGTISPPSSFALGKPIWAARLAAAKNYDPTFDATNWGGRVAGTKDFSAGKSSEMVRSANQTLHHVGQLLDSMDNLNNGNYPLWNKIGNATDEAMGSGAQGAFRTNAHAVAEELSKVFKGSNLSDSEIHAWEQNLHENMSPEQQRTQVAKLRDLLQGSLQALEEKRQNSIGPIAAEKAGPLIKAEGQRVLDRIEKWTKQGTGAAQGAAPAQTKTGVSWSVEK